MLARERCVCHIGVCDFKRRLISIVSLMRSKRERFKFDFDFYSMRIVLCRKVESCKASIANAYSEREKYQLL